MAEPFDAPVIRGIELRYVLTIALIDACRAMTVPELVRAVENAGLVLDGRPSKTVSDALRWEVRKARVIRRARGTYAAGRMPRSTEWWIRTRVDRVLARVVAPTLADGRAPAPSGLQSQAGDGIMAATRQGSGR